MAGGKVITDPEVLARDCKSLMQGAKKDFDGPGPNRGDMWFFELYHHLNDCAASLRRQSAAIRTTLCPGGGYNGQPRDEDPTVENCLKAGVCGCDLGDALR